MRKLVVVGLAALAVPAVAGAHVTLKTPHPGYGQRVDTPPRAVALTFSQPVKSVGSAIDVRDGKGIVVSGATRMANGGTTIWTALSDLRRGAYTVRWRALSVDGHTSSGVYTFGYGVKAPPPTEAYGVGGLGIRDDLVRWAYFAALALLLGGLGFRVLVMREEAPPAYERRFYRVATIGVIGVLELGLLAFLLRADSIFQLPFERLLYGDLSPLADGTRFGRAFVVMTLGYAIVAALVFLGWLVERTWLLWAAFMMALIFASGLSLSGHSALDPGSSWRSELADWIHLSAACIWAGGLVQLAVCLWPVAKEARQMAFLRFSRLAMLLVAVLVAAGLYLSILRLPRFSALWTEEYGIVLLVKLALVSVAFAWGGFHHFVVRRALESGNSRLLARLPRSLVGRSLVGESAVGMAVLLAAAVLVNSSPPPKAPSTSSTVVSASR
jgi:copper transport protein